MNTSLNSRDPVIVKPAATVMLFRHIEGYLEALLLKRNRNLSFAPDCWVFPGGRIDDTDHFETSTEEDSARRAAVRETREECGLDIRSEAMSMYYHWTTPSGGPKRFATWFFHALVQPDLGEVTIDNAEIVDYKWVRPEFAIDELQSGKMNLLPPTLISLYRIMECNSYEEVVREFERTGIIRVLPRVQKDKGIFYSLYQGDIAYAGNDVHRPGPRHRLTIEPDQRTYRFEYSEADQFASVTGGKELDIK